MFSIDNFQDIYSTLSNLNQHNNNFMCRSLNMLQKVIHQINSKEEDSRYSFNLEVDSLNESIIAHMNEEVMNYKKVQCAKRNIKINFYFYFNEFILEYALDNRNRFEDRSVINFHNMEYEMYDIIDFVINGTITHTTTTYYPLDNDMWIKTATQYFATTHYEGALKHSIKEYIQIFDMNNISKYLIQGGMLKFTNKGVYKYFDQLLDLIDDCNHNRNCEYIQLKE